MSDMDIEISTKKINMTLDEIIKQNRKGGDQKKGGPKAALKKRNSIGNKNNNNNNNNRNTTNNNNNKNNSNNNTTKMVNRIKKTGQGQTTPKKEIQKKLQAISPDKIKIQISNNKPITHDTQKPKRVAIGRPTIKRLSGAKFGSASARAPSGGASVGGRVVKVLQEKKFNRNNNNNNNNQAAGKTLNDRFSRK